MAKAGKLLSTTSLRERAAGAVRPGVEAMLLAAVALGCAQAGWTVLAPSSAGALNSTGDAEPEPLRMDMADVSEIMSPFAPEMLEAGQSSAVATMLSGVQLTGVRVSTDASRSGAVLTMNDGAQRAFAIGQEISAGVTLSEVGGNYVIVSYQGGEQQLSMSAAPSYSFARAMMGLERAPGAPVIETAEAAPVAALTASAAAPAAAAVEPTPFAPMPAQHNAVADSAPQSGELFALSLASAPQPAAEAHAPASAASADDFAWLRATLARVETDAGQTRGWRVAEPLPALALAAGLRAGDVVTAVNGAGPGDAAALMAAAQSGRVELTIDRGAERLTLTLESSQPT